MLLSIGITNSKIESLIAWNICNMKQYISNLEQHPSREIYNTLKAIIIDFMLQIREIPFSKFHVLETYLTLFRIQFSLFLNFNNFILYWNMVAATFCRRQCTPSQNDMQTFRDNIYETISTCIRTNGKILGMFNKHSESTTPILKVSHPEVTIDLCGYCFGCFIQRQWSNTVCQNEQSNNLHQNRQSNNFRVSNIIRNQIILILKKIGELSHM